MSKEVDRGPEKAGVLLAAIVMLLMICVLLTTNAYAERFKTQNLIRDTEIESTLRAYAEPLFRAAGLNPSAVKIYIVNDWSANAFVTGGQNLFITAGLLAKTEHAGQVIGVIAHETGHIAGGHLARTSVALGRTGGSLITWPLFISYSRTQELAADQAAAKFLDQTGQSARGLVEYLKVLGDLEFLPPKHLDPYVRTHPRVGDRISFLRSHLSESPFSARPVLPQFNAMHRRMQAKLHGFLAPASRTSRRYPETNSSIESRYAMAIAYYRNGDLSRALPLMDGLIADFPNDPYFHELKGQALFEIGRIRESLVPYQAATRLKAKSGLIRARLAQVQLELNDPALVNAAIQNLHLALSAEPERAFLWRQLAIAYGRQGKMGMSALSLAEEALLEGRKQDAIYQANRATEKLPWGSPDWLKMQDILSVTDQLPSSLNKDGKRRERYRRLPPNTAVGLHGSVSTQIPVPQFAPLTSPTTTPLGGGDSARSSWVVGVVALGPTQFMGTEWFEFDPDYKQHLAEGPAFSTLRPKRIKRTPLKGSLGNKFGQGVGRALNFTFENCNGSGCGQAFLLSPVIALVGGVYGATVGSFKVIPPKYVTQPLKKAKKLDAVLTSALLDKARIAEQLADQLTNVGRMVPHSVFLKVPFAEVRNQSTARNLVDEILTVRVVSIGLIADLGDDPLTALHIRAWASLNRGSGHPFEYLGEKRRMSRWSAEEAQLFREEIGRAVKDLAIQITETMLGEMSTKVAAIRRVR